MPTVLLNIVAKIQNAVKPISKIQNSLDKLQNSVYKTQLSWREGMHKIKGRLRTLPKNIEQIEYELERLRQKQTQSFSPKQIMVYEKEIKKLERELGRLERKKHGGFMPYMGNKLKENFSGLLTAGAGYLGISSFSNIASGIVKVTSEREQTLQSFSTMLGSQKAALDFLNTLDQFANLTPFTNKQIYSAAQLLKSFGIEKENILPYLKMLGDVSGGNVEKFQSLALAFAQVQSAGKLTGQDLLQFINAGFNPLQELTKTTKYSIAELKEMMSQGKITSDMVVQAFAHATSEGGQFYNMMKKQSETLAGKWSTFVGKIQLLAAKLGNLLLPVLKKVINIGIKVIDFLSEHQKLFEALAIGIGVLLGLLAAWIPLQWALNFALTANPIGLIIAGVAALIGLITYAIIKIKYFIDTWKKVRMIFGAIMPFVAGAIELVLQLFKAINYVIKYGFKKGLTLWLQEFLNSFISAINKLIAWANKVFHTKWKQLKLINWVNKEELEKQRKTKQKTEETILDKIQKQIQNLTNNSRGDNNKINQQLQPGIEAITSGGRKNIIINIQDFTGVKELNAYGIEDTISALEDKVMDALLRVMNSANEIA